jgi:hypothetical protein
MSEEAWVQMLDVLNVMKRGIVQAPKQPEEPDAAKPV